MDKLKKEFAAKLGEAQSSAKKRNEKLEIVQSERVASAGGRKGDSARPTNFGRNLFDFFRTHTAS